MTSRRAVALARLVRMAKAEGWEARNTARPQYLGPNEGHYDGCMGWDDCDWGSYSNPYAQTFMGL